jgi:hypothetical protein
MEEVRDTVIAQLATVLETCLKGLRIRSSAD